MPGYHIQGEKKTLQLCYSIHIIFFKVSECNDKNTT